MRPVSNSLRSCRSRATLCRATSSTPGSSVVRIAPEPLRPRQATDGMLARGQRRGQAIEPMHPRHLLDQVRLALDVFVAKIRDLDLEITVLALDAETEPLEDRARLLRLDALAE